MRWRVGALAVLMVWGGAREVRAEWQQTFRTASDTKIHSFQSDAVNANRILIGIEGGILESKDRGTTWKRSLTVPANQAVRILHQEPGLQRWWAATPRVIYRSMDGGRRWEAAAQFLSAQGDLDCFLADGAVLYAGRSNGLAVSYDEGSSWVDVPLLAGQAVFQISRSQDGRVWVASERGVYRSGPNRSWEQIYSRPSVRQSDMESDLSNEGLTDPDAGESPEPKPVYFWLTRSGDAAIIDGTKKIMIDGVTGQPRLAGALPEPVLIAPNMIGSDGERTVLATKRGVGLWEESHQLFRELAAGWPGSTARALAYDAAEDRLVAVTSQGVFQYEHPDLNGYLETRLRTDALKTEALLNQFGHEPGIIELQQAAMRYAEVHPEKIIAWRKLAARRAWLPSVGFKQDMGNDETVDIDRGGTNDADRFIKGPDERDSQWSVDLSWDLGDLVWSDDQTSIDNRSKLMVQLRDDLLTQLNHLYYSRRRLQVARLIESGTTLQKEIDRSLQIDEYTAGIDALTGGYFSQRINPAVGVQENIRLS